MNLHNWFEEELRNNCNDLMKGYKDYLSQEEWRLEYNALKEFILHQKIEKGLSEVICDELLNILEGHADGRDM